MPALSLGIQLLLSLLDRATAIGGLISKAQSEGRDITAAELDALAATDDSARKTLQDAIQAARAAGQ